MSSLLAAVFGVPPSRAARDRAYTSIVGDLDDMRASTLLFHLTKRLIYTKWRDAGEDPKLHLFGQLKRITKQWLDDYLKCKGGTYPAQLMYQELADMACNRIMAAINKEMVGTNPIKAMLDPHGIMNPGKVL